MSKYNILKPFYCHVVISGGFIQFVTISQMTSTGNLREIPASFMCARFVERKLKPLRRSVDER